MRNLKAEVQSVRVQLDLNVFTGRLRIAAPHIRLLVIRRVWDEIGGSLPV